MAKLPYMITSSRYAFLSMAFVACGQRTQRNLCSILWNSRQIFYIILSTETYVPVCIYLKRFLPLSLKHVTSSFAIIFVAWCYLVDAHLVMPVLVVCCTGLLLLAWRGVFPYSIMFFCFCQPIPSPFAFPLFSGTFHGMLALDTSRPFSNSSLFAVAVSLYVYGFSAASFQ